MDIKKTLMVMQQTTGYSFEDADLLETALTHTSFSKGDGKSNCNNERLEYLGDAVLELCVTEQLYLRYPDWGEGAMTVARAAIVCEAALYQAAKQFKIHEHILLGHGEEITGGRDKPSILSDALEALIGAIYLDGGLSNASEFILRFTEDSINAPKHSQIKKDYKTALQEYMHKRHLGNIHYKLVWATGPDHKKEFCIQAYLGNTVLGEGRGSSKQDAGQHAAQAAMAGLMKDKH